MPCPTGLWIVRYFANHVSFFLEQNGSFSSSRQRPLYAFAPAD